MNQRTFLIAAFAFTCLPVLGHADNTQPPPERRASVILPLLSHYSPKDTSAGSVMSELTGMMGKFNNSDNGGKDGSFWTFYSYRLDDATQVIVEFISTSRLGNPELVTIFAQLPDGKLLQLGGINVTVVSKPGYKPFPG